MCRHRARARNATANGQTDSPHRHSGGFISSLLFWGIGGGLIVVALNGCIDVSGSNVIVESVKELKLPTVGTHRVAIKTTNGRVQVRPGKEGSDSIEIRALIRAQVRGTGAEGEEQARRCLEAIEIATPVTGPDEATQEIGWAWGEPRQPGWHADVSFEIVMPVELDVTAETENGKIDVVGTLGDCQAKSVNGAVRIVAAMDRLDATTTNGEITVESPATDVALQTTNGRVKATLTNEETVGGKIETTNGSVVVELAGSAATDISCRTVHGSVKNKLKLEEPEKRTARRGKRSTQLTGKLAGGGPSLDVQTTNGDIVLEPYVARRSD